METNWQIKSFENLSHQEMYDVFQLRSAVFVVEQNCPYQDFDGKDNLSSHVLGYDEKNILVAYARILPKELSYKEISIGRVCVTKKYRNTSLGIELMKKTLVYIEEIFGKNEAVRISAQTYLLNFYKKFGFESTGKEYLEDDIPHSEMIKKL